MACSVLRVAPLVAAVFAAKAPVDKALTEQVLVKAGWLTFGTSFADDDVPKDFAPEDKEGEQLESLKESLGDDVFGAIAGATGMDKRPSSLSRDGAKAASHRRVPAFRIDPTAVSNDQFKRFVRDTQYLTEAENFRWSFVLELTAYIAAPLLASRANPIAPRARFFSLSLARNARPPRRRSNATINQSDAKNGLGRVQASPWWMGVFGAYWRKPEGPDSSLRGRGGHPATHISWNDASAYCKWAGRRLPTEVEWEMAARGGLEDEPFPWGDADHDPWTRLNAWEGEFPDENSARDGFVGPGPVDAYAPNAFGIYNALGNVWEWCAGGTAEKRPMRGGSFVDTVDGRHNHALRCATRMDQTADSGSQNTGFRCASDDVADGEL